MKKKDICNPCNVNGLVSRIHKGHHKASAPCWRILGHDFSAFNTVDILGWITLCCWVPLCTL